MYNYTKVVRDIVDCSVNLAEACTSLKGFADFSKLIGVVIRGDKLLDIESMLDTAQALALEAVFCEAAPRSKAEQDERNKARDLLECGLISELLHCKNIVSPDDWDTDEFVTGIIGLYGEIEFYVSWLERQLTEARVPLANVDAVVLLHEGKKLAMSALMNLAGHTEQEIKDAVADTSNFPEAVNAYIGGYTDTIDNQPYMDDEIVEEVIEAEYAEEYALKCAEFEAETTCPCCGGKDIVNLIDYIMDSEEDDRGTVHFIACDETECSICGGVYGLSGKVIETTGGRILADGLIICEVE